MKNRLTIMAAAVAALVGVSASVQATPISGSIGFTGTYQQNGGTLGELTTATSFTITSPTISSTTGSFVGAASPTFASPIAVNPASGLTTLWSVIVGSITYTFDVTSESQFGNNETLILQGTGDVLDGTPADTTAATWQLSFGVSGNSFTWQATSATNVPDGGTTVILLGAAFAGLCLFRKKVLA